MHSSTRPAVLILGANGRLGLAAAQAFAAAGWTVLAQVRREAAPGMPQSAQLLRTPLADTTLLGAQAAGARVVLHALNPQYTQWKREALPLLRQGVAVAERIGARLMLPGNVYNYGTALAVPTPINTPQRPHTEQGRIRVAMEELLQQRCQAGALRATVLTAGDFFGGGRGSWFDLAIVKQLAQGRLVYPGPSDVLHAWAYLPDLAATFLALAQAEEQRRFARLHFAGHALTGEQLLAATERAAAALGLAPAAGFKRSTLPWGLVRVGGLLIPKLRVLAHMSYLWRLPHTLDDAALRSLIGAVPQTPLDLALRTSLAALFPRREDAQLGNASRTAVNRTAAS